VQCPQRHQVDWAAKEVCQFIGKLVDFPPEPASGPQRVEDIDIAVRTLGTPGTGTKDPQFGDPVPVADFSQAGLIDFDTRDDQHKDRLSEACAQGLHDWQHVPVNGSITRTVRRTLLGEIGRIACSLACASLRNVVGLEWRLMSGRSRLGGLPEQVVDILDGCRDRGLGGNTFSQDEKGRDGVVVDTYPVRWL
jgi:hypothetical protein